MSLGVFLGHLVQVAHLIIVYAISYAFTRKIWIPLVWFSAVIAGQIAFEGMCPLTVLSNEIFRMEGHIEFIDLATWLANIFGSPVNHVIALGGAFVFFILGAIKSYAR